MIETHKEEKQGPVEHVPSVADLILLAELYLLLQFLLSVELPLVVLERNLQLLRFVDL
jgi:hypothetical protein